MKYSIGNTLHGFSVLSAEHIEEIHADGYIMEHLKSGARLMYIDADDDNKVFSIAFRTTPDNSKGIPHVLEHSTLCGSRKYPLKEPFVELAKGSLNTFLNAITWPDKTMYPIASRNAVDFKHLMDVYLDAVFYPKCLENPQILMQEGWHYELESKDQPLTYNGVVYNEMKGALSSPEAIMEDRAMEKLFPDTTYGVESGGDPEFIPSLTFREFKQFHRRFYHPSNSYIYLYGDMDIEKTLAYLDKEYLSRFEKRNVDSAVETQMPFSERVTAGGVYGVAEGEATEGKTIHALYTAMTDHMTTKESLALKILNYVLIEMDGAPLKKAVIEAGIGADFSGSYNDGYKQPVWTMEVTGSEENKQELLLQTIYDTLRSLVVNGFDKEMLMAALNRTEFLSRENDFQGRPKGLLYNVRVMDFWLYDREPFQTLRYIDDLNELRKGVSTGYFESLVHTYFLKNTHQVLITMKPEKGLTEKKNKETASKLEAYKASLSDKELDEIIKETELLHERQASSDSEEALKVIPLLERSDLNRNVERYELEESHPSEICHYHFNDETNGISYVNCFFTMKGIPAEDIPYVILLTNLLGAMDTAKHSYVELAKLSNADTGGISMSLSSYNDVNDSSKYMPVVAVRGKALTSKMDALMELIGEIVNRTDFSDTKRLYELLTQEKSSQDMSVFARGHLLVMLRLASYFSESGRFAEEKGLTYYYWLSDLIKSFETNKEGIVEKLQQISKILFTRKNLFYQTIGGDTEKQKSEALLPLLLREMPSGKEEKETALAFAPGITNEAFSTSGKVQYVAKGGNFKAHGFVYSGALRVMETILRYEYLWKRVRVLGGAYGAFTQFSRDGTSILCSYRDPNLKETLSIYEELPDYLEKITLSEREMTKYVIGTMAPEETQLTPPMKGERALTYKLTDNTLESRQQIRQQIIGCSIEDIRGLAPLVRSVMEDPYICVMGSEDKINSCKALFNKIYSMPN